MHAGQAADDGLVTHLHMSGQRGVVSQDGLVAHHAVVRDVYIGHDPVVVPDGGDAPVLHGADVEGAELADRVAVADLQTRGLARVFFVLRSCSQRTELEDAVVFANARMALDHAVRANRRARADLHMGADNRIRPHRNSRVQLRGRINEGRGMYVGRQAKSSACQATVRMVHMISASHATLSPTRATPLNL